MEIKSVFDICGLKVRTFYVEYMDHKNQSFYKPYQAIVGGCDDDMIVDQILRSPEMKGYRAYMIVELLGDYEMSDIPRMFRDNTLEKQPIRFLYTEPDRIKIALMQPE